MPRHRITTSDKNSNMALSPVLCLRTAVVIVVCLFSRTFGTSDGACRRTDSDGGVDCENADSDEEYKLTRIYGGKVGDVRTIQTADRKITLKTLSLKPLLFEMPEFLSEEECAHIVMLAKKKGLKSSETTMSQGEEKRSFTIRDANSDQQLSVDEMRLTIEGAFDIYPDNEDVKQIIKDLDLDKDGNGMVTQAELASTTPQMFREHMDGFLKKHPEKHSRYSNQIWLFPDQSNDQVFRRIQERVTAVSGLPLELVRMSDFQIVQYDVKGHYNAHYDSAILNSDIPCCRRFDKRNCRICRFMTVLFYLNDVEEGGETAFLVADNATVDHVNMAINKKVNLYHNCDAANLKVLPVKGKAVMWYNHYIKEDNQWLGEHDNHSLHGGCSVTSGSKWIANFWIKVTDDKEEDIEIMKKNIYT